VSGECVLVLTCIGSMAELLGRSLLVLVSGSGSVDGGGITAVIEGGGSWCSSGGMPALRMNSERNAIRSQGCLVCISVCDLLKMLSCFDLRPDCIV